MKVLVEKAHIIIKMLDIIATKQNKYCIFYLRHTHLCLAYTSFSHLKKKNPQENDIFYQIKNPIVSEAPLIYSTELEPL